MLIQLPGAPAPPGGGCPPCRVLRRLCGASDGLWRAMRWPRPPPPSSSESSGSPIRCRGPRALGHADMAGRLGRLLRHFCSLTTVQTRLRSQPLTARNPLSLPVSVADRLPRHCCSLPTPPYAFGYAEVDGLRVVERGSFLIRPPEFRFEGFNVSPAWRHAGVRHDGEVRGGGDHL